MILASAAYIVAATAIEKRASPTARAASDVALRIASRYAVGVHHTFAAFQPQGVESQAAAMLPQVDAAAVTRDDKLKAAIIAGEIGGAAAAFHRLDAVPAEPSPEGDDLAALRAIYAAGGAVSLTPDQTTTLTRRHDWFGRLALAYGTSGDDPRRREALRPAVRTATVLVAAAFGGIAALLIGFVLLVVALVRWSRGTLAGAYRPATEPTGPFLEAFAVYIAAMVGVAALLQWLLGERPASTWLLVVILPFVFLWPLLRGVSGGGLRAGLGWHRGRGFFREAGAGVIGYLAGLPVLAAGAVITMVLQRWSGSDT